MGGRDERRGRLRLTRRLVIGLAAACGLTAACGRRTSAAPAAVESAAFVLPPEPFIGHTAERTFIGPGTIVLGGGEILMAASWGRPPTNFDQLAASFPVPPLFRSRDGGRTWTNEGPLSIEWKLPGMISDGGISFVRLADGRLALVANRHVKGLHGGGTPMISISTDDGRTWSPARMLVAEDDAYYVMNDRLIQLRSGRLVLPVSRKIGRTEGDKDESLAMLSDDGGGSWRLGRGRARLDRPRGMQEPCAIELADGSVRMLARTGAGFIYSAVSDDGGETWSDPEATTLEAPCSSLTLRRVPDGRLVCLYNHVSPLDAGAFFPRTPLVYALSDDDGASWSPPLVIDATGAERRDRQNIYASACFTPDGMVVVWSTHVADPKGSFGGAGPDSWKFGGGKRCIVRLPKKVPATKSGQDG